MVQELGCCNEAFFYMLSVDFGDCRRRHLGASFERLLEETLKRRRDLCWSSRQLVITKRSRVMPMLSPLVSSAELTRGVEVIFEREDRNISLLPVSTNSKVLPE